MKPKVVEFGSQGSRRRQFNGLVSLLRDQLPAKLLRRQPRVRTPIPKLRVRLTETLGNVSDVVQQIRQLFIRPRPSPPGKGIATGDSRTQFVHALANRNTAPTEIRLGTALATLTQRLRRPSHEEPAFVAAQHLGSFDNVGPELFRELHDRAPSMRKKHYNKPCQILG